MIPLAHGIPWPMKGPAMSISTRSTHSLVRPLAVAVTGTFLLTFGVGCGSSDDVADKVSEKIAESSSGEDVDVDIDSDSGDVSIESADGTKLQMGTADLPEDWPAEIPLPDDYELNQAMSMNNSNSPGFSIGGTLSTDSTEVFDEVTAAFVDAGWTETSKTTNAFDGGTNSSASYENGSWEVIFSTQTIDGIDGFGYTAIQATE